MRAFPTFARSLAVASTLAVLALAPAMAGDGPTEAPYTYRAEVVDVLDGDTIEVHVDLGFYVWIRYQRIKLFGIDAPDGDGADAAAATTELESLIGGKTVIFKSIHGEDDPSRRDSFGNWLGVVWIDGRNVNDAMVESGHAVKTP